MKLVWWVRGPLEIVQRPIHGSSLTHVSLGGSVAFYAEHDTCWISGRTGQVTGTTFEENIDAYNKADDMRVARIDWIDAEIKRLREEGERLINTEIKEVSYESVLLDLVEREKARLLNEVSA